MSMFGWGVGDIATISALVAKVCIAYKSAPDNYRNISEEVRSLQILINRAVRHGGETTTLSDDDRKEGQEVLKGCQSILEDLNSLIEKYNSLSSANTGQVFTKIKLGTEDIGTLRLRLISNTLLLNTFIQRFYIPTINIEFEYIVLIPLLSCEIHARLTEILDLRRTNSRVSLKSITSLPGSINTKRGYREFCQSLYQIGVTPEMIGQKKREILSIFRPQNSASGCEVGGDSVTVEGQSQFPVVGGADTSISTDGNPSTAYKRSRFGWARLPIDFLIGPLLLAAAEAGDTKRVISTLGYIRNIDFEDDRKETSLHKAAYGGHKNIAQLLLKKGALIGAMNKYNDTPLHLAAWKGHTSTVGLLLANGAPIETVGTYNNTPLHLSASSGNTGVVELLLGGGASVGVMNKYGSTPLHRASEYGYSGIVELLLGDGAPIEAMDKDNNTPMHRAAWNGHSGVMELLLGNGASIEAMNIDNNTSLHLAIQNGHTEVVELLLGKGASIEAVDTDNNTPLHYAAWRGHTGIVELLLGKGASIEAKERSNNTPLDLAEKFGHTDIVKLLENKAAELVVHGNSA